jgi:hypothetical protein
MEDALVADHLMPGNRHRGDNFSRAGTAQR